MPSHEQQAGIQMRLDTLAIEKLNKEQGTSSNSLVENLKEALENDIKLHQNHLSSMEMCTNRQK